MINVHKLNKFVAELLAAVKGASNIVRARYIRYDKYHCMHHHIKYVMKTQHTVTQ